MQPVTKELFSALRQTYSSVFQTLDALCGSGRFPHVLLLEGEGGWVMDLLLQDTAARAVCEAESPPCMACSHCRKVLSQIHPDVLWVGTEMEKSYAIDKMRALRQQAFVIPNEARYTVFVLQNIQTIPEKSQNALLKILEEPPPHVIFLLHCTNTAYLLKTLLSRVLTVSLRNPSLDQGISLMNQVYPQFAQEEVAKALHRTQGDLSLAYQLLTGQNPVPAYADELYQILLHFRSYDLLTALQKLEKTKQRKEILIHLRQLLISGCCQQIKEESTSISLAPLQILQIVAIIDQSLEMQRQSVNEALLTCFLTAQITEALQQSQT